MKYFVIYWHDGEASIETEPPGNGSKVSVKGPFAKQSEARAVLESQGYVQDGDSLFFKNSSRVAVVQQEMEVQP